ncbi:MAG: hypothetical protein K5629_08195 [Eubacteriales bacterium]|nr:hypothetical protein [Eubacteriales bacterium]
MSNRNLKLAVYTLCHFTTDFICVYTLFSRVSGSRMEGFIWVIVYHGIAFGLQALAGAFMDKHPSVPWGIVSYTLITLGFISSFAPFMLIPAVALMGIGNAIYHIEGGYVGLHRGDKKIAPGGVFVGGGAFGVGLGSYLGKLYQSASFHDNLPFIFLFCLIPLALMFIFRLSSAERSAVTVFGILSDKCANASATAMMLFSVFVRGLAGYLIPVKLPQGLAGTVILSFAVTAGKMLSGILADRYGARRSSVICQTAAAVLAVSSIFIPALGLLSVFCLNLAMGVTLAALSDLSPDTSGFAFGLSPMALYAAYIVYGIIGSVSPLAGILSAATALITSALICFRVLRN